MDMDSYKWEEIVRILGEDLNDVLNEGMQGDHLVSGVFSGEPMFREYIEFQRQKSQAVLSNDELELGRLCMKAAVTYAQEVAASRSEEFERFLEEEEEF